MIYSQKSESFQVKKGPIFANFVLADEINRSPAKVQSALLEAMQESEPADCDDKRIYLMGTYDNETGAINPCVPQLVYNLEEEKKHAGILQWEGPPHWN